MIFPIKIKNFKYENKKLLENFLALSLWQLINYITPLFTFPYLIRVLGMEQFGFFVFITATISYFKILIDYGFNLTATRDIAINQHNREYIIKVFSTVIIIKFLLLIISAAILYFVTTYVKKFELHQVIYFLAFTTLIGETFLPIWFFQGVEDMKYITITSAFSKLTYTLLLLYLINQPSDMYKIFIISSVLNILISLHALYKIKKNFNIYVRIQSCSTIWQYMCSSWSVFFSNVSISCYTISTIFLLGLFTNNIIVGYFSVAEKIIQAFKMLTMPLSQALFPYINKYKKGDLNFIWMASKYITSLTAFISIFIFLFAQDIIFILMGLVSNDSTILLKIMSPLPLLISLSNLFGIQTILSYGRLKAFSRILFTGALLGIFLSLILIPSYHHIGAAVIQLIVETFITITMFFYIFFNIRNI